MGLGNEGGNSVRVKFGIGGRVLTQRGLVFIILNMSVMLYCWQELFVSVLSESQVRASEETVYCNLSIQGRI